MKRNYIGYFRSVYNNILYSVKLISLPEDSNKPFPITLSGDEPFIVNYNTSDTPFDSYRTSTATIKIVSDTYFENILPSKAQEVKVYLTNEDTGDIVWCGFLTPKIYDMEYVNCNEIIELEAADCVSVLQYIDYEPFKDMGIINMKNIIDRLCTSTQLLEGYYIPLTKKMEDGTWLKFSNLQISETNFFSSDMEEAWTYQEVLDEICKYLGLTAIQIGTKLHFVDYTAYNKMESYTSTYFIKQSGWENNYPQSTSSILATPYTITENDIMGGGASISFEPIYNKIYVNCNEYNCEDFIPNIFDDKYLTNRNGDFYESIKIPNETPAIAQYPYGSSWGKQKYVDEEVSDADYTYFHRIYDNKWWQPIYRTQSLTYADENDYTPVLGGSEITKNFVGATIVDLGTVKNKYFDQTEWAIIVANKMDYERYLCISQMGNGIDAAGNATAYVGSITNTHTVFELKPNFKSRCLVSKNAYLVIDYNMIFEKYIHRNYINPEWGTTHNKGKAGFYVKNSDLFLIVGIGDKYWNGSKWSTTKYAFRINSENKDSDEIFNTEKGIVNTVNWELNVNEQGYIIPLNDVDITQVITIQILLPSYQDGIYPTQSSPLDYSWNNYCWIKDFSIKVVEPNQDQEVEDNDIVYENIIDEENVNKLDDISLKITSFTNDRTPSYSNVGYVGSDNVFLQIVVEDALSSTPQLPEENIIERYYSQYSTPTKKIEMTVGNNISQLQKIYGCDVDNPTDGYVILGGEIDYLYDRQTITMVEKK